MAAKNLLDEPDFMNILISMKEKYIEESEPYVAKIKQYILEQSDEDKDKVTYTILRELNGLYDNPGLIETISGQFGCNLKYRTKNYTFDIMMDKLLVILLLFQVQYQM